METKQELLKQLIEAQGQLEELKKKIENYQEPKLKSDWYKGHCTDEWLVYYDFKNNKRYGFDYSGDWFNDSHTEHISSISRPATKEEVEEALIKEAKRRGFKEGVLVDQKIWNGNKAIIDSRSSWYYYPNSRNTFGLSNVALFFDGKWAEIIKEEKIEIEGYEVKLHEAVLKNNEHNDEFKIGCKKIFRYQLQQIHYVMQNNNFKEVSFDGYTVSLETIEKILKLKNK